MLRLILLPLEVLSGTRRWWLARAKRFAGVNRVTKPLGATRWGRGLIRAYENHATVRYLVDQFANQLPFRRRYLYYRRTLRSTLEFKNVWSRGVIGGFVNRNFVGQQPPIRHGTARVTLILHGRKIPMKPSKHRRPPPNVRGAARFRSRINRSGLGV